MNNKRTQHIMAVKNLAMCIVFGLVCAQAAYSQTGTVSFPHGFIETWKRDNFNNTLTFTAKTVKSSSSATTWNLASISGNSYKLNNGKTVMTLTIRLVNGNVEISGDSGSGENNWNGTWKLRPSTMVQGANMTAKLVWMLKNAQSNGDYTIELNGDETFSAQTLAFEGKANVTLRFTGGEEERTITLTDNGALFTVASGVNLVLNKGVTLRGNDKSNTPLVLVNGGGMLIMNEGSKITGNTSSENGCGAFIGEEATFIMNGGEISGNTDGGVFLSGSSGSYDSENIGGNFIMNGGKISGNTAEYSGGVYVGGDATFTMNGGKITGNTISASGGGVFVASGVLYGGGGRFTMSGGEISGNTAESGGGVFVRGGIYESYGGKFTISGGVISGNTASNSGGGVYAGEKVTFTMSGGEISGNTANYGGGVFVRGGSNNDGIFTMSGGKIFGNTASGSGGGVYSGGTFTMSVGEISGNVAKYGGGVYGNITMKSGEISGNTASDSGGGVYITKYDFGRIGTLAKTGGTIYGYTEGDGKSNTVKDGSGVVQNNKGHAVFVDDSRRRESSTGPGDKLDINKAGLAGGWGY